MLKQNLGLILALAATAATAQDRTVPARLLPVPTDVSPQMQAIVSRPIPPNFDVVPRTPGEWAALQAAYNTAVAQSVPGLQERLHVRVEQRQMAGVTVYEVTPDQVAHENRDRLLIHIHGGLLRSMTRHPRRIRPLATSPDSLTGTWPGDIAGHIRSPRLDARQRLLPDGASDAVSGARRVGLTTV